MFKQFKKVFASKPDVKKKSDITALTSQVAVDQLLEMLGQYHEPDKLLQELGKTRSDLRRLFSDDEIAAALETRLSAVIRTGWHLESADSTETITEFVNEQLNKHIEDIVRASWSCVPYGYSVLEVIYREIGKTREWKEITHPDFEWFRPQQDGTLLYYPQFGSTAGYGEKVNSEQKFFLTRRDATVSNPHGKALLAQLWWPWFFRTNGWDFWAKFLERHGSPLLIGKTQGDTAEMASALNEAVQSAIIAINKDDEIQAVSTSNTGQSFSSFHAAIDKRIQKVILGQTLTSDVGDKGSYAAAKVHDDVRQDRRISDCMLVSKTINRMICALVDLNYPNAKAPIFVMEDNKGIEMERAGRDKILTDAGMVKFGKDYIVNNYDLEPDDFDIPVNVKPIEGLPFSSQFKLSALDNPDFTPQQKMLEKLVDDSIDSIRQPITQKALKAAISEATSPEDLAERLSKLIGTGNVTKFNRVLERALYAADVVGYAASQNQEI